MIELCEIVEAICGKVAQWLELACCSAPMLLLIKYIQGTRRELSKKAKMGFETGILPLGHFTANCTFDITSHFGFNLIMILILNVVYSLVSSLAALCTAAHSSDGGEWYNDNGVPAVVQSTEEAQAKCTGYFSQLMGSGRLSSESLMSNDESCALKKRF
jgi:hypothetical protein